MRTRESTDRCRVEVTLTRTESTMSIDGPVDLSSQNAPPPDDRPPAPAKSGQPLESTRERITARPRGSRARAVEGSN